MSDIVAVTIALLMFLIKSPWIWASVIGFSIAFRLDGKLSNAKKYLLLGCAVVFAAYIGEILMNMTMPSIWHAEGLGTREIARMIVKYNRIVDIVSASGFLLIIRAVFVSQSNSEIKNA